MHKLRVQHGGARRSANGVVAQQSELVIENGTRAYGPDDHGHALTAITIQPGLRPLNMRLQINRRLWGLRQIQLVDRRREVPYYSFNFFA